MSNLQHLPYLNAVINETLRMYPVLPSHNFRITPPEGLELDDSTIIPGGTEVMCPQWAINHSEDFSTNPHEWQPERWTTRPDMIRSPGNFSPFSLGTMNCIGKPLALMSMRLVIANTVAHFDISLPSDGTPDVVGKSRDVFTLTPPPVVNITIAPRSTLALKQ